MEYYRSDLERLMNHHRCTECEATAMMENSSVDELLPSRERRIGLDDPRDKLPTWALGLIGLGGVVIFMSVMSSKKVLDKIGI